MCLSGTGPSWAGGMAMGVFNRGPLGPFPSIPTELDNLDGWAAAGPTFCASFNRLLPDPTLFEKPVSISRRLGMDLFDPIFGLAKRCSWASEKFNQTQKWINDYKYQMLQNKPRVNYCKRTCLWTCPSVHKDLINYYNRIRMESSAHNRSIDGCNFMPCVVLDCSGIAILPQNQ